MYSHYFDSQFSQINSSVEAVKKRNILEILQSSLKDHPTSDSGENQMRYKLIIDASEDGSLMRLLFAFGVLQRKNTRVYVLSDFPGDAHLQKVTYLVNLSTGLPNLVNHLVPFLHQTITLRNS